MVDYLISLRPANSVGTLTEHTPFGVLRKGSVQIGGGGIGMRFFPFRVYRSPADPTNPDRAWRTFRVRAGRYGDIDVLKTDGANADPDDAALNPNPDFDAAIDIVAADSTAKFFIYIDATNPAAPTIAGSATAKSWGSTYIKLAEIDTLTKHDEQVAIVRQLVRADLLSIGSECPYG